MKDLEKDEREIRLTFTVICESPICMQLGDTLNEKVEHYVKMCSEAIESEMRHWGDHTTYIDLEEAVILDNNGENVEKIIEL